MLDPPAPPTKAKGGRKQPNSGKRDDPYGHADACERAGQPPTPLAIVASNPAEIVRLILTLPVGTKIEDVLSVGLSLGFALRSGMRHLYMLDGPEIEFALEGPWDVRDDNASHTRLALTFIDPSIGGTGYVRRIAEEFHLVAQHAIDHLNHPGCETACYRCLKSYQNQRYHEHLRWPLAMPYLEALAASAPVARRLELGDIDDPRPWLEAYAAGVGSPLELKFLRLFEAHGLHPEKQYAIPVTPGGRPITIADFAEPERRLAIYVDGAAFHRGATLRRDRWIRDKLRGSTPPWRVEELRASDLGNMAAIVARLRAH